MIVFSLTDEQHEEFRTVSVVDYGAYILVRVSASKHFYKYYPQVGVGAAIMLQSLIGSIGTLMGCFGNKQVWRIFIRVL